MQEFNKLVRDKIPDMIRARGETPCVEILSDDQFLLELDKKLIEEMAEYQESKELEELADLVEVIAAICKARGFSMEELHQVREEKRNQRGGFSKKLFLRSKE